MSYSLREASYAHQKKMRDSSSGFRVLVYFQRAETLFPTTWPSDNRLPSPVLFLGSGFVVSLRWSLSADLNLASKQRIVFGIACRFGLPYRFSVSHAGSGAGKSAFPKPIVWGGCEIRIRLCKWGTLWWNFVWIYSWDRRTWGAQKVFGVGLAFETLPSLTAQRLFVYFNICDSKISYLKMLFVLSFRLSSKLIIGLIS